MARQTPSPSAGYSGTPLWKKLGYKPGLAAHLDGAPEGYADLLALPADVEVTWLARPPKGVALVHVFERRAAPLERKLKSYRGLLAANGALWVSWPKKASGVPTDVTEDTVRALALPLGLVDIKVCAVDATWSGLKLVVRRELR